MSSSASLDRIKELRARTGLGVLECKKALAEVNGDFDAAVEFLRMKGANVARNKMDRETNEGAIGFIHTKDQSGRDGVIIIDVRSETDFVAKNEKFLAFVDRLLNVAKDNFSADVESLMNSSAISFLEDKSLSVSDLLIEMVHVLGENIKINRIAHIYCDNDEFLFPYIHNAISLYANMGKICSVAKLKGVRNDTLSKNIAMQIAAFSPTAISASHLDPSFIEQERKIITEASRSPKLNDELLKKVVDGKLAKSLKDYVLLEQDFLLDGEKTVSDVLAEHSKQSGREVTIEDFIRYSIG